MPKTSVLKEKPVVRGFIIDTVSPSAQRADVEWPDEFMETIVLDGNPTEAVHGDFQARFFHRGTLAYEKIHAEVIALEQEIKELSDEMAEKSRAALAERRAEVTGRAEIKIPQVDDEDSGSDNPSKTCAAPGPHHHCEIPNRAWGCLNEDDKTPICFNNPDALRGHVRGAAHQAEATKARTAAAAA